MPESCQTTLHQCVQCVMPEIDDDVGKKLPFQPHWFCTLCPKNHKALKYLFHHD